MQTSTHQSAETRGDATAGPASVSPNRETDPAVINAARLAHWEKQQAAAAPPDFVPLHLETRTHVSTAVMCRHLGRREQTGRGWACAETYPPGLKPLRVMGRLAWPVSGIKKLLGVA